MDIGNVLLSAAEAFVIILIGGGYVVGMLEFRKKNDNAQSVIMAIIGFGFLTWMVYLGRY